MQSRRVNQIMQGRNAEEKEESEGFKDIEGWGAVRRGLHGAGLVFVFLASADGM